MTESLPEDAFLEDIQYHIATHDLEGRRIHRS